ncbi:MAG TPA: multicopper oxidase domain-containing protein [Vicinamibacterales bacterium]|nr:multicopper oxidase domain-containing protein [Vicinamibacterales bacterium]
MASGSNREYRLKRRELLQFGIGGFSALGASALRAAATDGQTPGSGQGAQPPQPPPTDAVVDVTTVPVEDWTEPWIWRPSEWPGRSLALNIVGNSHPPRATSPGNRFTPLYSFNGSSPGPTIRMRGDEVLRVTLRNHLGPNLSRVPKGPAPDPFEVHPEALAAAFCRMQKAAGRSCDAPPNARTVFGHFHEFFEGSPIELVDTSCVSGHVNVPHGSHTTNLHTHGLHVEPGVNPNGTFGDNTYLRVLPRADSETRKTSSQPGCRGLAPHERVAEAEYEHRLGNVQRNRRKAGAPPQPHPPGTHWYHPHAHGSTQDQVASGLAGFLIVEGDVDDAINRAMTGTERPDPCVKTGPYDYRERLMLIQRVEVFSVDADAGPRRGQARIAPPTAINGGFSPTTMFMRPGAVERWRVLNGSVDGRGFKSFMVLEGQFVFSDRQLWRVLPGEKDGAPRRFEPATRQDVADATRQLFQLSLDGITLVEVENGRARHTIRDLSRQNAGTHNPLDRQPTPGEDRTRAMLKNVEDCYRDGDSLRNLFVRPNQVFLTNANRTDVFFKAPLDAAGKIYTVFAQEFPLPTDNFQQRLQVGIATGRSGFSPGNPSPADVVVGYVKVTGDAVAGGEFDVMSLRDKLPPVPTWLQPIEDAELRVPAAEAARRGVAAGSFRTRVISYSGYGPTDFPLIEVPEAFTRAHPELKGRLWDEIGGARVLLAPFSRTMAVNGEFDLAAHPAPPPPQKMGHHDSGHPRALVETSEEWVVYNCSVALWSHTDKAKFKQPGQYGLHYRAYPIGRADGQRRFAADPEFQITTKGADHPFHIHVNPCWVTRIDVPDEHGRFHNILGAPQWMDTVSIPRGGRVVFRSRFADYTGMWVNHCHILMHEDHGMMQAVAAVASAKEANYRPRTRVASHAMSSEDVNAIYPPPSLELMYAQSMSFVDTSPELGHAFPGFPLEVPAL